LCSWTAYVSWRSISLNSAVISLHLQSDCNTSAFANVHIFADVNFNDLDHSPVITLDRQAIEKGR
jgi:hypothetical protein